MHNITLICLISKDPFQKWYFKINNKKHCIRHTKPALNLTMKICTRANTKTDHSKIYMPAARQIMFYD